MYKFHIISCLTRKDSDFLCCKFIIIPDLIFYLIPYEEFIFTFLESFPSPNLHIPANKKYSGYGKITMMPQPECSLTTITPLQIIPQDLTNRYPSVENL